MDSPSYLEPAIGLWDWIIWGSLGSNSSDIHRLLKAMRQCFHTNKCGEFPYCQQRRPKYVKVPTWHIQEYKMTNNCAVCCVQCQSQSHVKCSPFNLYAGIYYRRCQSITPCRTDSLFTRWCIQLLHYLLIVNVEWEAEYLHSKCLCFFVN